MLRSYEETPAIPEPIEDFQGNVVGTSYPMDECVLLIETDGRVNLVAEQSISLSGLRRLYATLGEILKADAARAEA